MAHGLDAGAIQNFTQGTLNKSANSKN